MKLSFMFCLMSIFFYGCQSQKKSDSIQKEVLLIELKSGLTERYLNKKLAFYNPTNINRSSKSKNEYSVILNLKTSVINEIHNILELDENIIGFSKKKTTISDPANTANEEKGRVNLKDK